MEKVLSTAKFVLSLADKIKLLPVRNDKNTITDALGMIDQYHIIYNYANLMQQSPELGMFWPCIDGKPLEKPIKEQFADYNHDIKFLDGEAWKEAKEEYKTAKAQVLFDKCKLFEDGRYVIIDGISVDVRKGLIWNKKGRIEIGTIEDLAKEVDLMPTKEFLKQIGLTKNNLL